MSHICLITNVTAASQAPSAETLDTETLMGLYVCSHHNVSRNLNSTIRCHMTTVRQAPHGVNPWHQLLVQMPKDKVSWLLCIGRLVSNTDNVKHFAHLVKKQVLTWPEAYRLERANLFWGAHYFPAKL